MTGHLILAILGVASAGNLGHHGHGQAFTSDPSSLYRGPGPVGQQGHDVFHPQTQPGTTQTIRTITTRINGVMLLDGHVCILRDGEIVITGPILAIGDSGSYEVGSGFANSRSSGRFQIDDGLVHCTALSPTDVQGVTLALAEAGMTLDEFIQQTGTIPPGIGIMKVTSGVISINGVYRNINVGVFISIAISEPAPAPAPRFITEPITGHGRATGQELIVTVTAVHVTQTIRQPVTLTKTRTVDRYTTITSPVYNRVAATITNFVKQTVAVPEDQVIRSPLPGRVVVNTVPVVTQVVLTVTDTATQFFVQTALDTITSTLQHLAPNFNFRTVTVNNPQTSTVVQTITRTSVASVYVTNTVDRTFYSTATVVFTVTESINNPGGY